MHDIRDTVMHGFRELGTVGNVGYPFKPRLLNSNLAKTCSFITAMLNARSF